MAFCDKCGFQVNDDSKFCPNCGSPVEVQLGPTATATPNAAPEAATAVETAPQQAKPGNEDRRFLVKFIVVIAILVLGFQGLYRCVNPSVDAHPTLESELSSSDLTQLANDWQSAVSGAFLNLISCSATVSVKGNALTYDAKLGVDVDRLLDMDIMRYYEGLGVDKMIANYVFNQEASDEMVGMCKKYESGGYENVTVTCIIEDSTGSKLASRTFTSSGYS